jgi:lipopolysaccharide export system permease protein
LVTTVLLALGVLTFVMAAGELFRAFDWLSRGGSPAVLGKFLLLTLPDMMRFTLPLSMLCATVLVFSQLSADNEITAMKSCGISLWQVIAPGLLLSVLLSAVCFWFSTTLSPHCRYAADQLMWEQAAISPAVLLAESDNFIELEGLNIRVDRREGELLHGIHILVQDNEQHLEETITARQGRLHLDPATRQFELVLQDATLGRLAQPTAAPDKSNTPKRIAMGQITVPLSQDGKAAMRRLARKPRHMDLGMLFARIYLESEAGGKVTPLLVELHSRMSMSLSPIAFLLIGIPFAVRGRRAETSVGLLLSLLLALGFYAFMLVTRSLKSDASLHPEVLVWLPNLIYQVGGLWALVVIGRH